MDKNKPEKTIRAAPVSATIWNNESVDKKTGQKKSYKTITVERHYKDQNDKWQATSSFRAMDLPKVVLVTNKAFEYISLTSKANDGDSKESLSYIEEEDII